MSGCECCEDLHDSLCGAEERCDRLEEEIERLRKALEEIAKGMCAGYCTKGIGHCSYPEVIAKEALGGGK